ncbi:hypothetical protein OK006_8436 [Actinobacteria bacterium OK006]|nr:hypothetical protein OK006_8436 [Actinobacteria bacterium OK006]
MPQSDTCPASPNPSRPTAPGDEASPSQGDSAGRLTVAQVLPTTVFPMIGSLLYISGGMPPADVFTFLAGCGGIGAAVTIAVTGGRRPAGALAHGILAAASGK